MRLADEVPIVATLWPQSADALLTIPGIGLAKAKRYGETLRELLSVSPWNHRQ